MRVRILGTLGKPQRCAFCHDQLEAVGRECADCKTELHLDCWREVRVCPTAGCGATPPPSGIRGAPRRHASPRPRRGGREHVTNDQDLIAWAEETSRRGRVVGSAARLGIYLRLILSLGLNLAILLCVVLAAGFMAFSLISETRLGFSTLVVIAILLAILFGGYLAVSWLVRWPGVWKEVGRLLNGAQPQPMRLRVWKTELGRSTTTHAEFRSLSVPCVLKVITVQGVLPPRWLRQVCARKPVLVYGFEDREPPFLVEDTSGQIALVSP